MARVSEAEIERLKAEVSLVSLAEAAGAILRRTGADLTGCCPFHEDGTPSLVISLEALHAQRLPDGRLALSMPPTRGRQPVGAGR